MDASSSDIPEGRQRLLKIFALKHIQAAELKERIRGVVSEKASIEIDDRANQLVVTDYTDNIRLLGNMVKEFDVDSPADSVVRIFTLKNTEAEDITSLLTAILNAQASPASPRPSSGGGSRSMGPMNVMPGGDNPQPTPGGGGSGQSQAIKIWPDKTTNRLIVSAPKSKIPDVENLLNLLDTEKTQDITVRVIPLKHVSAEDLVREIAPLYQKMTSKGMKENIEVTANSRSNSLILLSSEANFRAIKKLVDSLDTEEAQEKVMQAFVLNNADAEDVAKQLQDLNQEQDSFASRYVYYYGMSSSNNKGGGRMNVVADRRRNTVVVQAPPATMEKVAKMIQKLDEPVTDNSLAPKIYPLKYVSASDIEEVLNELFLKKSQQRSYYYYDDYPQETADKKRRQTLWKSPHY